MTTHKIRKIAPFKDAEEIKKNIPTPRSLWQQGCDDAKAGRPARYSGFAGAVNGYTQGYEHGTITTNSDTLPVIRPTDPGVYIFPCGTTIIIRQN
jgi:hypothetical protein